MQSIQISKFETQIQRTATLSEVPLIRGYIYDERCNRYIASFRSGSGCQNYWSSA